jgi:hypothetical protein
MCMALYLAADEPVPTTEWREGESVFVIQPLNESQERVRKQFTKPAVFYLGAHTGCSCGFAYGQLKPETPEQLLQEQMSRRSVEELQGFLAGQVANGRDVELFACWEGDQGAPPEQRLDITPSHFTGESFELQEKAFYRVRGAAQQGVEADEA